MDAGLGLVAKTVEICLDPIVQDGDQVVVGGVVIKHDGEKEIPMVNKDLAPGREPCFVGPGQ